MSRQTWVETLTWITSSATAVANTTTETVLVPALVIPANTLQDGRALRFWLTGGVGSSGTPTITYKVRWGSATGGTILAASAAITLSTVGGGASMTALWTLKGILQTRTNGATGTLFTQGEIIHYTTGTAAGTDLPLTSGTTGGTTPAVSAAVDLTADTALSITALWSAAATANSIQTHTFHLEILN